MPTTKVSMSVSFILEHAALKMNLLCEERSDAAIHSRQHSMECRASLAKTEGADFSHDALEPSCVEAVDHLDLKEIMKPPFAPFAAIA